MVYQALIKDKQKKGPTHTIELHPLCGLSNTSSSTNRRTVILLQQKIVVFFLIYILTSSQYMTSMRQILHSSTDYHSTSRRERKWKLSFQINLIEIETRVQNQKSISRLNLYDPKIRASTDFAGKIGWPVVLIYLRKKKNWLVEKIKRALEAPVNVVIK